MDEKPGPSNNAEPHSNATEVDVEKAVASQPPTTNEADDDEFPSGIKVLVIMLAVWLSMFLVALVRLLYPLVSNIHADYSEGPNNPRNSHSKNHR